jgi:two-component system response regulator NreC
MTIRVLLADDHAVFRSGVRALLEQEPDLEVTQEASTGPETLEALGQKAVDVLLLDLSLPGGLSGSQIAEAALEACPKLAIVVLTMHDDEYYLREMLHVGVQGYVTKKSDAADVVHAVRAAAQGSHFIDRSMVSHVVDSYIGKPTASKLGRLKTLTARETEVCRFLAMGYTNAEVGDRLSISRRTVDTHRANIMAKLSLRSRADVVRFAIDNGLLRT